MPDFLQEYFYENKPWIVAVAKLFLVAIVVGGIAFLSHPGLIDQILGVFTDKFGPEPARDINFARQIFLQNAEASALALFGGILLGLSSVVIVFLNGFIIGFVVVALLSLPGDAAHNFAFVFLGLAPHGIFEIPAFLLASALGLRLGVEWILKSSIGRRGQVFVENLKRAIYVIPLIGIMLLIAAFVEVFVSGQFVSNF